MQNYFETQPIHWHQFSPKDIIFKSNAITKKLLPEENVLSWKTKDSRHEALAEKTGATKSVGKSWQGNAYTWYTKDSYNAVFVQLTKVKKEFVCANVDFVHYLPKVDSNGDSIGNLDALVYINSFHDKYEWKKDSQGNWGMVKVNSKTLPDDEGYRIAYGGQGDSNYLNHRELLELIDISEAIRNFLVEEVLPLKRGMGKKKDLTLVGQI